MQSTRITAGAAVLLIGVIGSNVAIAGLDDGLVAWYPFNGNANDESGNGYNATVFGATLAKDRDDNPDSAYRFNGLTNYISTPVISRLTGNEVTLAVWVKAAINIGDIGQIIETNLPEGELFLETWEGGDGASDQIQFGGGLSCFGPCLLSKKPITFGQWYHVVGIVSAVRGLEIYINGVRDASVSAPARTFSPVSFSIGKDAESDIQYWNGILDDIRIYNRALSSVEVKQLFDQSATQNVFADFSVETSVLRFRIKEADASETDAEGASVQANELKPACVGARKDSVLLKGTFVLDQKSDGINPTTEAMTATVGSYTVTIPAGSFIVKDGYQYHGTIDGAKICARLKEKTANTFALSLNVANIDLAGTANPVKIKLSIGNDRGRTQQRLQGVLGQTRENPRSSITELAE